MRFVCAAILVSQAQAFSSPARGASATSQITRAHIRAADFDPFSSPRGPPADGEASQRGEGNLFDKGYTPPPRPSTPEPPQNKPPPQTSEEEQSIILGARVLGGGLGGISGNALWSGIERAGLTTCTPFNLDGCADRPNAVPAPAVPVPKPSSAAMDDAPFADILRNPTSILPQEWALPGRKYLGDIPSSTPVTPTMATPAAPAVIAPAPVPAAPVPAPMPVAELSTMPSAPMAAIPSNPMPATPSTPMPSGSMTTEEAQLRETLGRLKGELAETPDEKIARLRDELMRMQEAIVPPAGAAEPPGDLLSDGLMALAPGDHATSTADVWFAAVADSAAAAGGSPLTSLVATIISAAAGAVAVEYMATNSEPPFPDPLFSGLYKTFHGAVRAASKAVGAIATPAAAVAGPAVGKAVEQAKARVTDLTGGE